MDKEKFAQAYGNVVAKTWSDPDYLDTLKGDPVATLKEAGIETAEGAEVDVEVMAPTGEGTVDSQYQMWAKGDRDGTYTLWVPTPPDDLGDEAKAASGDVNCCCTPCCCCT
jgi:hypothetical protein